MKLYNYKANERISIYVTDTVIQLIISNGLSDKYAMTNKSYISFNYDKDKNKYITKNFMYFDTVDYVNKFVGQSLINSNELKLMIKHNIVIIDKFEIYLAPSFLLELL